MLHKCIWLNLSLAASSRKVVSPGTCLCVPQPTCTTGETSTWEIFQVGLMGVLNQPGTQAPGMPQLAPAILRGGLLSISHPQGTADWGLSTGFGSQDALQPPPPTSGRQPRRPGKRCWSRVRQCCSPSQLLAGHHAGSGEAAPSPWAEAGVCWAHLCGAGHPALCILITECKKNASQNPMFLWRQLNGYYFPKEKYSCMKTRELSLMSLVKIHYFLKGQFSCSSTWPHHHTVLQYVWANLHVSGKKTFHSLVSQYLIS